MLFEVYCLHLENMSSSEKCQLVIGHIVWSKWRPFSFTQAHSRSLQSWIASSVTICGMLTTSHWGAAWGQLCHRLEFCKLAPASHPKCSSQLGSSLGCLAATVRVRWTAVCLAVAAEQRLELIERVCCPAGTCKCCQQCGAWLVACVASAAYSEVIAQWTRCMSHLN